MGAINCETVLDNSLTNSINNHNKVITCTVFNKSYDSDALSSQMLADMFKLKTCYNTSQGSATERNRG